jgi:hypothetical protein
LPKEESSARIPASLTLGKDSKMAHKKVWKGYEPSPGDELKLRNLQTGLVGLKFYKIIEVSSKASETKVKLADVADLELALREGLLVGISTTFEIIAVIPRPKEVDHEVCPNCGKPLLSSCRLSATVACRTTAGCGYAMTIVEYRNRKRQELQQTAAS